MDGFKQLVDETSNIKDEIVRCHVDLKNNLIDKGVKVTDSDKLSDMISKTTNLVKAEGTLPSKYALKGKTFINSSGKLQTGNARAVITSTPTYQGEEVLWQKSNYTIRLDDNNRYDYFADSKVCKIGAINEGTSEISYTLNSSDIVRIDTGKVVVTISDSKGIEKFKYEYSFDDNTNEKISIEAPCKDGYTLRLHFSCGLPSFYYNGSCTLRDFSWTCGFEQVND